MKKKQILIADFHQETNSFCSVTSDIDLFSAGFFFEGKQLLNAISRQRSVLNGLATAINEAGGVVIPSVAMRASRSGGPVKHEVVNLFIEKLNRYLNENQVDGVFLSLHGATQSTEENDVCGYICETIRERIGQNKVIAVGCDLHANVTHRQLRSVDVVCGYQTYPHCDYYQTGHRAGSIGMRILSGEKIAVAYVTIPMIVPATGYNTNEGSFRELIQRANAVVQENTLIDYSIFQMQPWLDVNPAGSTVIAIAKDGTTAKLYAESFAKEQFDHRDEYWPDLRDVGEIIVLAEANKSEKPIVLVDAADSAGSGSYGDSVAVLSEILKRNSPVRAASVVCDPEAVQLAFRTGVGNKGSFCFGAKYSTGSQEPICTEAIVRSLHDGQFQREGITGRGTKHNMGKCAVISFGNIDVLLCSIASGSGDTQLYRHFGIEPLFYQLIVVKANTSFRAAYSSIAKDIFIADTPGPSSSKLLELPFRNMPAAFYPFDPLHEYVVEGAQVIGQ